MTNYSILAGIVLYLILRVTIPMLLKGRESAELERERDGMRQQIMRDPRNGAAYHELARSYYKEGKLREALQVYQALMPYVSEVERFEVNQRMQDLDRDIRMEQETKYRAIGVDAPKLSHVEFCRYCGASNPMNARQCWECHQFLDVHDNPLDNFHRRWQDPAFRRTVTDTVMGVGIASALIYVCYNASTEQRIMAIILAGIFIAWQVWLRISGR